MTMNLLLLLSCALATPFIETRVVFDDAKTHVLNTTVADFVEIGSPYNFPRETTLTIGSAGSVLPTSMPGRYGQAAIRVGNYQRDAKLIVKEGATIKAYDTTGDAYNGIELIGAHNWLVVEGGTITGGSTTSNSSTGSSGNGIVVIGGKYQDGGGCNITGGTVVSGNRGTALAFYGGASANITGGRFRGTRLLETRGGGYQDRINHITVSGGAFQRNGYWNLYGNHSQIDVSGCIEYDHQCGYADPINGEPYCSLTGVLADGSPIDVRVVIEGESSVQVMNTCAAPSATSLFGAIATAILLVLTFLW